MVAWIQDDWDSCFSNQPTTGSNGKLLLAGIHRGSVVRGFKKCGLSTIVDGSKSQEVHIKKIPDYQMPLDDDKFNEKYS